MVILKNGEYNKWKEQFDLCEDDLSAEIKLLQNMPDIPNNGNSAQTIHSMVRLATRF